MSFLSGVETKPGSSDQDRMDASLQLHKPLLSDENESAVKTPDAGTQDSTPKGGKVGPQSDKVSRVGPDGYYGCTKIQTGFNILNLIENTKEVLVWKIDKY